MRAIYILLILVTTQLHGQESFQIIFDSLYSLPGAKVAIDASDLSARTSIFIKPDSIIISLSVTDNELNNLGDYEKSDRVEVWFGYPWLDFADFIVGKSDRKTRIFRNTAEAGDNADLGRFLNDGDYPEGNLIHPESGKTVLPEVPDRNSLRRELVFSGLVRLVFRIDGSEIIHANRESYTAFEEQTSYELADLSKYVSYTCEKTGQGYEMQIKMSIRCLGFARPEVMQKLRMAVDVYDTDSGAESIKGISTSKNRYYARSFYMNQFELPFSMQVELPDFPPDMVSFLKINQDVVYTTEGWKAYGMSVGNIVYAKDLISESGLQEFYFYKTRLKYSEQKHPVEMERIDINYQDLTVFEQHEVYLRIGNVLRSGKKFRYTGPEKEEFFYRPQKISDTSFVIAYYDYEVVDPLGFGEFGRTADEFIYIEEIGLNSQKTVFNSGQRLEAAQSAAIGENPTTILKNIKSIQYSWVDGGQGIKIKVKGLQKEDNKEIILKRNPEGNFKTH